MADTKFSYTNYPNGFGEYVRFEDGKLTTGDWEGDRGVELSENQTKELFEKMSAYYKA